MPAPINANLTPPSNTWEGGNLVLPQGVLDILSRKQAQTFPGMAGGGGGMAGLPSSWMQYGMMYPDVMAGWQRESANPKNTFSNAEDFFKWHYGKFGKAEGRQGPAGADAQPFVDHLQQKKSGGNGIMPLAGMLGGGVLGHLINQNEKNPGKTMPAAGLLGGGLLGQLLR